MHKSTMLSLLGVLLLSASCATPTAPAPPTSTPATDGRAEACKAFEPIIYSRKNDTVETIEAVKKHNAAWDALCGDVTDKGP